MTLILGAIAIAVGLYFSVQTGVSFAADSLGSSTPCSFPVLETGTEYSVGSQPFELAVGDLNNDGKKDIVSANYTGRSISVLVSDPAGGFLPATNIDNGCLNKGVELGDLNSDGNLDAVVVADCQTDGAKVSIFLGNGSGGLSLFREYPQNNAESIHLADIDGDNELDIFLLTQTEFLIYEGDGMGEFAVLNRNPLQSYGVSRAFAIVDFDHDGDLDVALGVDDRVRVWKGDGHGAFTEVWSAQSMERVYSGDFNNDGNPDLVTINDGLSQMRLFLGDGTGNFALQDTYETNGGASDHADVADVNGDGIVDVVTSNFSTYGVSVFLSRGDGTFWPKLDFNTSVSSGDIVIADITGDNIPDLVVAETYFFPDEWLGKVIVTEGIGDGRFRAPTYIKVLTNGSPDSIVMADLNGDGKDDIIIGNVQLFGVSILLRTGDLIFAPRHDLLEGKEVMGVTAGDLNADGHIDVVAVGDRQVYVLLGNGQGDLALTATLDVGGGEQNLMHASIQDYDHDGFADMVVGPRSGGRFFFYRGIGDGTFSEPIEYPTDDGLMWEINSADFNGDGRQDLAILFGAGYFPSSRLEVWLNIGAGFTFHREVILGYGTNAHAMAVGDFNSDGKQDLAYSIGYNAGTWGYVGILNGLGNGDFAMGSRVSMPDDYPIDIVATDMNVDGILDLGVAQQVTRDVVILEGNGAGDFEIVQRLAAANYTWRIASGNLTPDSSPDFVVANYLADSITVIANNCNRIYGPRPTPTPTPTPSPFVTVAGRVTTPMGRGIRSARVVLIDQNGVRQNVFTNSFGYYMFNSVATGRNYVVNVAAKRYRFAQRSFFLVNSLTDIDFIGDS